jgi:hypothetical protein
MDKISKEYVREYLTKIARILKIANSLAYFLDIKNFHDDEESIQDELLDKGYEEDEIFIPEMYIPGIGEYLLKLDGDKVIKLDEDHLVINGHLLDVKKHEDEAEFVESLIKLQKSKNVFKPYWRNHYNRIKFDDVGIRFKYPADNPDYNATLHIKSSGKNKHKFTIEIKGREKQETFTDFKKHFLNKLEDPEFRTEKNIKFSDFKEKFFNVYISGDKKFKKQLKEQLDKRGYDISFSATSKIANPFVFRILFKNVDESNKDKWQEEMGKIKIQDKLLDLFNKALEKAGLDPKSYALKSSYGLRKGKHNIVFKNSKKPKNLEE